MSLICTPRTDAEEGNPYDLHNLSENVVRVSFARDLERENARLREALTALVSYTEACEGMLNASPAGQVLATRAALKGEGT